MSIIIQYIRVGGRCIYYLLVLEYPVYTKYSLSIFYKCIKVCFFYIAQYPARWTAQSALNTLFALPGRSVHSDTNSASPGSILVMQQLRAKTKSLTFPPLSIARYTHLYSWVDWGIVKRTKMPKLRNGSKVGFEPGFTRLRVRHSTAELPRSKCAYDRIHYSYSLHSMPKPSTWSHSHLYNPEQQSLRFVEHPYNFNSRTKH